MSEKLYPCQAIAKRPRFWNNDLLFNIFEYVNQM